jgi:hypothetical protein
MIQPESAENKSAQSGEPQRQGRNVDVKFHEWIGAVPVGEYADKKPIVARELSRLIYLH